jgi:hypothetical protein
VSVTIDISERELKLSVIKIALSLAFVLIFASFIISLIFGNGQNVALIAVFGAMACFFAANTILASLKIVDWFEARKAKKNA